MNKRSFIKTSIKGSLVLAGGIGLFDTLGQTKQESQDKKALFQLPKLPYAIDALEPHIDAKTMEIHHTKHHQAYINKLNEAIEKAGYTASTLTDLLKNYAASNTDIRNHGGGHWNHEQFWLWLTPKSTKPDSTLNKALERQFGSFDNFKADFNKAAISRFGSGWSWLCYNPKNKELYIESSANQDNPLMGLAEYKAGIPLLGVDVWEHAYYLRYQNRRADYLSAFWNVVNWDRVSALYNEALKL
jgi:Fe-Mn family superoxide dismutase